MSEFVNEREELIHQILEAESKEKEIIENRFIPWLPRARPFTEQKAFFRDKTKTKLVRTGNRAAKTFSTHRDLAWKIMRNHPYRSEWREDYDKSKAKPKKMWVCGPSFEFLKEVSWDMYLKRFIPRWYYTNDQGDEMIVYAKHAGYEFVEKVYFRNGDVLEFKSYMQNILTKMGRSIDVAVLDEMPPKLMVISEIVTRVFDRSGEMTMGFTPLNPNPDIKHYLEKHPKLATHTWPLSSNPLYRDDPEKMQRVLDEYSHLPRAERDARMNGDWYYENNGEELIFCDVFPEVVDDFEIPLNWRRMIVVDPASHITGFAIFAENPETTIWYLIESGELFWRDKLATTDDIIKELERRKPYEGFKYVKAIYDNAEAWFGAHAGLPWRPCMEKHKKAQIIEMRNIIVNKKLVFFAYGAASALLQIHTYKQKDGKIVKHNDHIVDCIQYFAREIPPPATKPQEYPVSQEAVIQYHMHALKKKWAAVGKPANEKERGNVRFPSFTGKISRRKAR